MLQLNPPIPLVTSRGKARAIVLIDRSEDHDLEWVCILENTGEIWVVPNKDVRQIENWTFSRSAGVL